MYEICDKVHFKRLKIENQWNHNHALERFTNQFTTFSYFFRAWDKVHHCSAFRFQFQIDHSTTTRVWSTGQGKLLRILPTVRFKI